MRNPLEGLCVWAVPSNTSVTITLFRDARTNDFEDKEWTFVVEDVRSKKFYNFSVYNVFDSPAPAVLFINILT